MTRATVIPRPRALLALLALLFVGALPVASAATAPGAAPGAAPGTAPGPAPDPTPPAGAGPEAPNGGDADGLDDEAEPAEAPPDGDLVSRDAAEIDDGVLARSDAGRSITLLVRADGSETFAEIASRVAGSETLADELASANEIDGAGNEPAPKGTLEVPWALVRAEYRLLALRALFPADAFEDGAYAHRPADAKVPGPHEGLWQVALWFTGDGARWPEIAKANRLDGPSLPGDRPVRVPGALLLPDFRPAASGPGGLVYGRDAGGPYAEHRMARGEALYSSVIVRFTDLTRPGDVNAAAEVVRARSGIGDVRKIEVGQRVRIPLDLLATAYLPANHPRRVLAALHEDELELIEPRPRAIALEGVHVLLDPGHGGDDVGAKAGRIWESDYVYDVACRVQRRLEQDTSAKVRLLVRDTQYGCRVFDRKALPRNRREVVDSKPPVKITRGRTKAAVNRRPQLANEIFGDLTVRQKVAPDNVVFISLHADSLHKSLRGSTVYVPGERYRAKGRGVMKASRAERLRDEAVSRRLAAALLDAYRAEGLPVHENRPVRDHVVRGRGRKASSWVPAVLKGNDVPAKVLLETVNIGNPADAKILEDPAGRERIARAVVDGLLRFYSGGDIAKAGSPAAAATPASAATKNGRTAAKPAPAKPRTPAAGGGRTGTAGGARTGAAAAGAR